MDHKKIEAAWRVSERYKEASSGSAELKIEIADAFMALRAALHGEDINDGDRVIQLLVNGSLAMSDSRDELRDHWEAIDKARGRVLVNGLGLGCYLSAILTKNEVRHVDVVEVNADVITLVGPYFHHDGRVAIRNADAFSCRWPRGSKWDCVWHDVWPSKNIDDLREHAALTRSFAGRAKWQGCWAHDDLVHRR